MKATPDQMEASRKRSGRWKANGTKVAKRKQRTLNEFANNATVDEATAAAGISVSAYLKWRQRDPAYAAEVDRIRERLKKGTYPSCPFTEDFRSTYFLQDYDEPINPPHITEAIEFISDLKPGQFGLILWPPEHAKSSLGEDWLCQGIANDPETRCVVISKSQGEAQKRLLKVQARMEDIDFYPEYIDTFGPFKPEGRGRPWAATKMTVARKSPRQRDFSVQAVGIGSQIQGTRIDRALLDDIEDDQNYREYLSHARYIRQSVNTRLGNRGIGLMIGTRQDEMDIYRHLMDEQFFDKVLIRPARSDDGTYLWPTRYTEDDYDRMERKAGHRVWQLTYQQHDVVSEGQAFPLDLVESAYDNDLEATHVPEGCAVVVGVDPATTGFTAGVALAVHPKTGIRTVVDVWNEEGLQASGGDRREGVVQFIVELCKLYRARRLCLEDNSAFTYVSSAPHLRAQLSDIGCTFETVVAGRRTHHDDHLAVTLSTLFSNGVIKIPAAGSSKRVYVEMVRQLTAWRPNDKRLVRDIVKALYYAEWAARRVIESAKVPAESSRFDVPEYLKDNYMMAPAYMPAYMDD